MAPSEKLGTINTLQPRLADFLLAVGKINVEKVSVSNFEIEMDRLCFDRESSNNFTDRVPKPSCL